MIKQNWNICEDEKLRILSLHESATKNFYIIKEQTESQVLKVDFGNLFESGRYDFNPEYLSTVNNKIKQISEYINGKKLKDFKIVIEPGESQVPNQSPFERVGSLAEKRGEVLKAYLEQSLLPLIQGVKPEIVVNHPVIGETPWDPSKGKDAQEYKKEQFVNVNVVLNTIPPTQPYKRQADIGESIFMNTGVTNFLIGFIQHPLVRTTSPTDPGFQDTGHQNLIFSEIKRGTSPIEVIASYEVPWQWWNRGRSLPTTRHITLGDLEKIRTFRKID